MRTKLSLACPSPSDDVETPTETQEHWEQVGTTEVDAPLIYHVLPEIWKELSLRYALNLHLPVNKISLETSSARHLGGRKKKKRKNCNNKVREKSVTSQNSNTQYMLFIVTNLLRLVILLCS